MNWKRVVWCVALAGSVVGVWIAEAQVSGSTVHTWSIEPASRDTYTVRFTGRTLSSAGTPTVTLRKAAQADGTPAQMIVTTGVNGSDLQLVIAPDTGCGSTGCRAGNVYQLRVQPTDSNGNQPTAVARINVRWQTVVP